MLNRGRKAALTLLVGVLALGLVASVWAMKTVSSEEQQGTAADSEWTLVVDGLVQSPLSLTFDDLIAMPTTTVFAELYCVGLPTIPLEVGDWTGVRLGFILDQAGVLPEAWKLAFYADDGFTTDLPLTTAMRDDIILAYERDGEPLIEKQLVVPCKWGYKWIREPTHIELVDYDFLGKYESGHFSDEANRTPGDIDCDGLADADDNCESAFNPDQSDTDADGWGDACDDDGDNDGWKNAGEVPGAGGAGAGDAVGSDALDVNSTPEVCDGVDNDGNEGIDEGFPDNDTDGQADCHDDDFDADADGGGNASDPNDDSWEGASWHDDMFPDAHENYLGTDKDVACSTTGGPDNDPLDVFIDGTANVYDTMKFFEEPIAYGTDLSMGDEEYRRRLDLFGPDGNINVFDVMQYHGEPQALGADCPYGL